MGTRLRPLNPRGVRSVYLITYSQADLTKVSTRESFAHKVKEAFQSSQPNDSSVSITEQSLVEHWVCCQEPHREGGHHYHLAVKLRHRHRWLQVRNYLSRVHDINVNFSSNPANYFQAWQYVTKEDNRYIQSPNHPDFSNSEAPQTTHASAALISRSTTGCRGRRKSKKKTLSVFDVSQIAVKKGIRTKLQLLALAETNKRAGKLDLAQFIANRGAKAVDEALRVGWELTEAPNELERQQASRYELLENAFTGDCVPSCNGRWYRLGSEILVKNGIQVNEFAQAVRTLLIQGRGKYRNILLHGVSNCGKTFLLQPLNVLYKTFTNPANDSFAFVGAESSEVIFLNDFRWSPQVIPWHNLLLLLEGQTIHLAAPKTHFSQDIVLDHDVPIFCTTKEPFTFVRAGVVDLVETQMMAVRWRTFHFFHQIPAEHQVETPPCGHCFARLIMALPDY